MVFNYQDQLKARGNYIGTNISGMAAITNNSHGIVDNRNNGTVLFGGSTIADRNIVSGNGLNGYNGAALASTDTLAIKGNYFGCNRDCSAAIPNIAHNISLNTYTNPVIGGSNPGEGNVAVRAGNGGYYGILIMSGSGAQIKGNYTGITPNNVMMTNASGVYLVNTSNAVIGGSNTGDRNYLSGNNASASSRGITIENSTGTTVQGNYIGVDTTGTVSKPNGYGIFLIGASVANTIIGGNTAAARNIISGNQSRGIISLATTTSSANISITGNYVGLDANGNVISGATGYGISLTNPNGIRVGGAGVGEGNIISGNGGIGLLVEGSGTSPAGQNVQIFGNIVGLKPDGETPAANGGYGITLNYTPTLFVTPLAGSIQIGGASTGQGNIVSGNASVGIGLYYANGTTNPPIIRGNKIGVTASGAVAGNGGPGILARFSVGALIGGVNPGEGNLVKNNARSGIAVDATTSVGNRISIRGNSISNNNKIGIDLWGLVDTPDPNDPPPLSMPTLVPTTSRTILAGRH